MSIDMTDEQYHSHDSISKTKLNHFAKSTLDYWHYHVARDIAPPAPKRQMVIGLAVHDVLLEGGDIDSRVAVYTDDCFKKDGKSLNPTPAEKFRDANPDKYVMKAADCGLVRAACDAVMEHELGELIRHPDAVFETPIFWECEQTGLKCRAKPDFYIDMGDRILAYDLKTTEEIYPYEFSRTAKRFRYWLQDAHYSAGLRVNFGKPVEFKFWVVEVKPPFRIAPREYDGHSRDVANQAYRNLMGQLAECYRTNEWRDEWTRKTTYLTLGPWDVDISEELEFDDADAA